MNYLNFDGHQQYLRTAEARVVKFYMPVGYVKSHHKDDKSPFKGAWSGSRDPLYFHAPSDISGTAEAIVVKFLTNDIEGKLYTSLRWQTTPKRGVHGQCHRSHVTRFFKFVPITGPTFVIG